MNPKWPPLASSRFGPSTAAPPAQWKDTRYIANNAHWPNFRMDDTPRMRRYLAPSERSPLSLNNALPSLRRRCRFCRFLCTRDDVRADRFHLFCSEDLFVRRHPVGRSRAAEHDGLEGIEDLRARIAEIGQGTGYRIQPVAEETMTVEQQGSFMHCLRILFRRNGGYGRVFVSVWRRF